MKTEELWYFLRESNAIERIKKGISPDESAEASRFLALSRITTPDLERFVDQFQPGAKLRDKSGMDVRVGSHIPSSGGPIIRRRLELLFDDMQGGMSAYRTHQVYEHLHPFTDCNGRSGRILWLWQMQRESCPTAPLGFLQTWYYQSLEANRC